MSYQDKMMEYIESALDVSVEDFTRETNLDNRKLIMQEISSLVKDVQILENAFKESEVTDRRIDLDEKKFEFEKEKCQKLKDVESAKERSRTRTELMKALLPLVISMGGYYVFQTRVLRFEESGRVSSFAGRELHLPKFW